MGTILKNSEWENKTSVKKGNIGEEIVKKLLESHGFVCYQPVTENAHAFDMLEIKNKETMMIAEVKTKSLMLKYAATGFPYRNFSEYENIYKKYKIPIFVFFVDEGNGEIYGNWLMERLEKPVEVNGKIFPCTEIFTDKKTGKSRQPIRLYHYSQMQVMGKLTEEQINEIKQYARRNYKYRE